jgi:Protein kinase domain/WD40-like Beta Propeller Repeat
MGEVYRATDTRLKRQVAVKILPPLLAADPDRLARFQREAEVLASLNHPGIAAIYGVEDAGGMTAIVMELVEGEDLADRIVRGPIPADEALPIAKQIAEALEAAHERGIMHRDLKPANIKLRPDGAVKVLDFGLAKLADTAAVGDVAQSPTITSPTLLSAAGVILGTAAYMSPEQARGQPADKRSDIWAFGVVVFEMLAGQRPFAGDTISDTLASVLKTEPEWRALPAVTPPRLRGLLRSCLHKNPRQRLRDIGDARLQIDDLIAGAPDDAGAAVDRRPAPGWRGALPWTVTAACAAALGGVLFAWAPWRVPPPAQVLRFSTDIGADASMTSVAVDAIAISHAGDAIAFVAQNGANAPQRLYVRRLDQLDATPLAGTDDAASPFFSPDGRWIAFFADSKLKKIAVSGGAVVELCSAPIQRGGVWDADDTIVLLPNRIGGLVRVPAAGGVPQPLTTVAEGEFTHRWPQMLPGGRSVLFTGGIGLNTGYNEGLLLVQPLPTGSRVVVQRGGFHARYLPSGHVVYIHDGTLFAVPFSLDRLAVTGPPVPVLEGIVSNAGTGSAQFAVSDAGTLVYLHGPSLISAGIPMQWMDQSGKVAPLRPARVVWTNAAFSPAGERLAVQILATQSDIWVYDLARETLTAVTVDPAADVRPVWSPDGRDLAFGSARADNSTTNLYLQRADGTGGAMRLTTGPNAQQPASWHASGHFLMFEEVNPKTNRDLMILPMEGDAVSGWKPGQPAAFLNSAADEQQAAFSPDGRWVAYTSNESGRDEVYVRPFPGPGGKWQISTDGGYTPVWSRTRHELFYGGGGANLAVRQIMMVPYVAAGDTFTADKPRLWTEPRFQARGPNTRMFDVHPDGKRVVLALSEETALQGQRNHLTMVWNFFDELRRLAPAPR